MAKKQRNQTDNSLRDALRFISVAQRDKGTVMQTHCAIHGGFATACDGAITAAYPVPDTFDVALNTRLLMAALDRADGPVSITQTKPGHFVFRADGFLGDMGNFRAHIPTLERAALPVSLPDANQWPLNDAFKAALALVHPLATEKALRIPCASILASNPGAVAATNLEVIMESWHGVDIPVGLTLPKEFAVAICKISLPLIGFGFSENSMTVYFENGAWIKGQLYAQTHDGKSAWPNLVPFWRANPADNLQPIPTGFFDALDAVKPHCENGVVYLLDGYVSSSPKMNDTGASITLDGLPKQPTAFNIQNLNFFRDCATQVSWKKDSAYFCGQLVRGVVMGMRSIQK